MVGGFQGVHGNGCPWYVRLVQKHPLRAWAEQHVGLYPNYRWHVLNGSHPNRGPASDPGPCDFFGGALSAVQLFGRLAGMETPTL